MKTLVSLLWLFALACMPMTSSAGTLREGWQAVDGLRLFYREGGSPDDPTVVFLHGYPLSSIQYARVMEQLADRHLHVIAVDYPSFGYSDAPDRRSYRYSFDHLAQTVAHFLAARGIHRYSLYMQDYGVPVGFRLIGADPSAITAVMVQNGVIHLDGFPAAQDPQGELRRHWRERNEQLDMRRTAYAGRLPYPGADDWDDEDHAGPDAWALMRAATQRPGVVEARNDLWFDYGSNVERYPAWQALLRKLRVPVLVLWGKRDEYFTVPGAWAYRREAPQAEVHILDSTHFATLDAPDEVAGLVGAFLERQRDALPWYGALVSGVRRVRIWPSICPRTISAPHDVFEKWLNGAACEPSSRLARPLPSIPRKTQSPTKERCHESRDRDAARLLRRRPAGLRPGPGRHADHPRRGSASDRRHRGGYRRPLIRRARRRVRMPPIGCAWESCHEIREHHVARFLRRRSAGLRPGTGQHADHAGLGTGLGRQQRRGVHQPLSRHGEERSRRA